MNFEDIFLYLTTFFLYFLGVCYSYDTDSKRYINNFNFQWDWTSSKVKYYDGRNKKTFQGAGESRRWEAINFMGANFLFNEDGVVFGTPLARSYPIWWGGESGTIILKKERSDEFIIANGKWIKDRTDYLQNLAGSAIAKGNFYGSTESG